MTTKRRTLDTAIFSAIALVMMLVASLPARAQEAKTRYPNMAPLDQYMMERAAEATLARTAAPESISKDAEVIVLGRHGYETAEKGKNGFVCAVLRSWAAESDDPEFWNPSVRSPICFNAAAARSYVPQMVRRTELLLSGRSKAQTFEELNAALDKKELPPMETGAMCYMMSKQGHLSDRDGHWHPHLMFFLPLVAPESWGANLPSSPVLGSKDTQGRLTVFLVPVAKWSDGTPAAQME